MPKKISATKLRKEVIKLVKNGTISYRDIGWSPLDSAWARRVKFNQFAKEYEKETA